ncbi:MAG: cytochrome c [Ferruginibacter sp.]
MKKFILIAIVFFVAGCTGDDKKAPLVEINIDGERLFVQCSSCHRLDKDFTGPTLKGSLKRWGGDKKAMYDFIRNSAKSIEENAYAKKLFEKWNKTRMTAFPTLTDAQLDAIMKYVETSGK